MQPSVPRHSWSLYLLADWIPLTGLATFLLVFSGGLGWREAALLAAPVSLFYGAVCLAAWYPCRATPLRTSGALRVIATHASGAALSSGLAVLIGGAWARTLFRLGLLAGPSERFVSLAPLAFVLGVLLFLLSVAAHYAFIAVEESQQAETRGLAMTILAREAELKALRAQIDPHFLFNCLNSISALTGVDPGGARRMCQLLGGFLRETIRLGARGEITLAEELALADRFLEIENIRFGDRLRVAKTVEEGCERGLVPSLLLQPLVENAVTHGVGELVEGGTISIDVRRNLAALEIRISNPRDPESSRRRGTGVGLPNVRKRLEVRHGSAAWMEVRRSDTAFDVVLGLPWHVEATASVPATAGTAAVNS
jgi:hypothetical protein